MRPSFFRIIPGIFLMGMVLFFLPFLLLKLAILFLIGSFAFRLMHRGFWYRHRYSYAMPRPDTIYALPDDEDEYPFRPGMYGCRQRHSYGYRRQWSNEMQDRPEYRDRDFVSPLTKF